MAAFIKVAQNPPTKRDLSKQRAVDPGDAVAVGIDQQRSLHTDQDLFGVRGWGGVRIRTELQTNKFVPFFADYIGAWVGSGVFKKKRIGHGSNDVGYAIRLLFLALLLRFPLAGGVFPLSLA